MSRDTIAVATWNTQWASTSGRGAQVKHAIAALDADVLVITEGRRWLLPDGGHTVDAGDDWGYRSAPHRRKAMLWSRWQLTDVTVPDSGAAQGRVVAARTHTPLGEIQVLAVCIPWRSAHVSTGRSDATDWSEHLECCDQIDELITHLDADTPTVIAGDFNQRLPRRGQPVRVADRLTRLLDRWTVHTAGDDVEHGPLIDHIASDLQLVERRTWPGRTETRRLSDHSGALCRLTVPVSART